jgi:hypothetical protein
MTLRSKRNLSQKLRTLRGKCIGCRIYYGTHYSYLLKTDNYDGKSGFFTVHNGLVCHFVSYKSLQDFGKRLK